MIGIAQRRAILANRSSGADALRAIMGGGAGLFIDFLDDSITIADLSTPANNYRGKPFDKLTFTRASSAWRFNSAGLIESVGSDVSRIDYDPSARVARGLLIEGARTNITLRSEAFDNATWTKVTANVTVTADATISPDGTANADQINCATTSGDNRLSQNSTVANDSTVYSGSIFLKKNTSRYCRLDFRFVGGTLRNYAYVIDLDNGTSAAVSGGNAATQVQITAIGGGWYRVAIVGPNNSSGNVSAQLSFFPCMDAAGTTPVVGSTFAWGAQIEVGAIPSSYIPTAGATVTRAAEVCKIATTLFPATATGPYTIFAKGIMPPTNASDSTRVPVCLSTNSFAESRYFSRTAAGGVYASNVTSSSANATVGNVTVSALAAIKFAARFDLNNCNAAINGTLGTTDTTCAYPSAPTQLNIGNLNDAGTSQWHGWIQQIAVLPVALTDAQIQAVTA